MSSLLPQHGKHGAAALAVLLAVGALAGTPSWAAPSTALSENSLVVFTDWTAGGDVEGKVVVGGDVIGNAANIAIGSELQSTPAGEVVLTVVGDINNGNDNIQVGSVVAGGDITANINLNQAGNFVQAGGAITGAVNGQNSTVTPNSGFVPDVSGLIATLVAESAAFEALTPNSSLVTNGNNVIFQASPDAEGRAVFDVGFGDVFGNQNANVGINFNGADEVIINVAGDGTIGTNFAGLSESERSRVIWNFFDADTLRTERQIFGSILAPSATFTNTSPIEGSVAVNEFVQQGRVGLPVPVVGSPLAGPVIPECTSATIWACLAAVAAANRRRVA